MNLIPFLGNDKADMDAEIIHVEAGGISALDALLAPAQRMSAVSDRTRKNVPYSPSDIGVNINADLLEEPKRIVQEIGNFHPGVSGLEPEVKAQMNLVATRLMPKAAEDAKFFTDKAEKILGYASDIHADQVRHKNNAFSADLRLKSADAQHLLNTGGYQTRVLSIADKAREGFATINLASGML